MAKPGHFCPCCVVAAEFEPDLLNGSVEGISGDAGWHVADLDEGTHGGHDDVKAAGDQELCGDVAVPGDRGLPHG